ncbi:MAG TPA: SusC/RagA family TonB-linked outer membrane protein [Candidatus Limisoma intestinavium]|uniref:SusC/RagA family TonB-linked outer membrane protein n=1 Tax=Candidatus Limisoma intestinavium TaxID=2840856 RepID=A0A9D1IMA3_9BACT|nr:SusC/RagA family TonB-linked outer membrane protein [Candidatus Limisoma intestinavium]
MRKQLLLLLFSLFAVVGYARTVTGVITSAVDKLPVIGASISVEGTTRGTTTDLDGKYSIDVDDNSVLVVSYVGMTTQRITVGSRSVIDVELQENAQVLEEVVVTAMGQTQEKKKLNFAVQSLSADDVTAGQSVNFANSLQGKVAGLQVSSGGSSPNSSTQVIIRAISSINTSQSNEPLVILDGMPIRGGGSTLGDLNANDIENMSVLKGAAASALYGQEAANGVIMITTKKGKEGRLEVTASGSWEISNAIHVPKIQDQFIAGSGGFFKENSTGGWGPYLTSADHVYDNVGGFLGTGFLQKYDMSISGGGEKFNAYASASYLKNDGIVPEDYKDRLSVFLKAEFKPSDKVTMQLTTNFVNAKSRAFGNSMSTVYGWAINKNMADYATPEGRPNWSNRYENWDLLTDDERISATVSPYYGRYMDESETESTRMILNGQISYEPIKNLVFTGKVGYDKGFSHYESYTVPRFVDSDFIDPESSALANYRYKFGAYTFSPSASSQLTAQILGTYNVTFNEDYTLNVLAGAEYKLNEGLDANMAGQEFLLDGFYSFMNTNPDLFTTSQGTDYYMSLSHTRRNKFGYFGELRFDYKGMAQLSVTGRYDGSSTLKQVDCTYFYPSVTAGVIFSELFKISNDWFSYGKLRGNWAKVGKDAPAYRFTPSFKNWEVFPDGGWGIDATTAVAKELEPEMTSSWEIGADLRFFDSRTRLDVAWYSTTVDNQIVTVRVSPTSGTILQTRNEGSIENKGLEVTFGQDILRSKDFDWTLNANFSFNRGKVISLPEDMTEIQGTQYGDIFPTAYLHGSTTAISGKDYERAPDGQIIVNENGYPVISAAKGNLIGNREPDWLLGLGSTFRWKDLTVGFLFDGRCGGDVVNVTRRSLFSNGMDALLPKYRSHEAVFKGVVKQADGTYVPNTTPIIIDSNFINNYFYTVSSNFIEDGSYIRLSYVTLAYDFTRFLSKNCPIKGLKLSATGRNLFLLTKYTGTDPQILAGTGGGTGSAGIDNYNVPTTRSFNFSLSATF